MKTENSANEFESLVGCIKCAQKEKKGKREEGPRGGGEEEIKCGLITED